MLQNENNGTQKDIDLTSMYLAQQYKKAREAKMREELEFEEPFEDAYTEWKWKVLDAIERFMNPFGIMIAWFTIVLLIFWLGIGNL